MYIHHILKEDEVVAEAVAEEKGEFEEDKSVVDVKERVVSN
jgi:hypothetical protein